MKRLWMMVMPLWGMVLSGAAQSAARGDEWGYRIGQTNVPPVVIQSSPEQFRVYPNHPRLFFRATDLPTLHERIKGPFREEWNRYYAYAEKTLSDSPVQHARMPKEWFQARAVTFVAALTGEARFREWAVQWANQMIAVGFPPHESDDNYRGRLMSLAIVYDWLYPQLAPAERSRIRDSIVAHVDRCWSVAERPNFIGGHSRWGNFSLAAGLLAIITEKPELRAKLLQVRSNWINGYFPAQAWIAVDGGYHMGTAYGAAYNLARIHCIWSSATNESVYLPYREWLPYYWIYSNTYAKDFPRIGDFYGFDYDESIAFVSAGVFKNPYAAWWGDQHRKDDTFYNLLYGDQTVKPLAPDNAWRPLPLSRLFRNAGYVIMRDQWNDRSTLVYFKSSSFTSENHHHRDQNSFIVYYRGRQAIDSGVYQGWGSGYGSEHWYNYDTRTIAHNAVTIFDPSESFGDSPYGPKSNDGGQMWLTPETLKDIQPGGFAHLDGITAYAEEGSYAFATGDATKAYSPKKCRRFLRSFLYLRSPEHWGHPIMFVYDQVISTKPEFKKTWLLHSIERPQVKGHRIDIAAGQGRLYTYTLLPEKPRYEIIGGPGKRFWVNGRNYPLAKQTEKDAALLDEKGGAWRVEVSPPAPALEDRFLHMMTTADRDDQTPPPVPTMISADHAEAVVVDHYAVLFCSSSQPMPLCHYEIRQPGVQTHLAVGLVPAQKYLLFCEGKELSSGISTAGGTLLFELKSGATGNFTLQADR